MTDARRGTKTKEAEIIRSVTRERFSLALERLPASAWERFEQLASALLRTEYPSIRRTSAPAGDLGVDAMLWQPEEDPVTLIQYSVTKDWADKIVRTAKRIRENFDDARILIYATNQTIGPAVHDLRGRLAREFRLHLDVRDREWFLESMTVSHPNAAEAERFSAEYADPYLASREVFTGKAQALTTDEARAAVVYLGMQWEDDTREKGLTKLSFEALTLAAMRGSDNEHRLARSVVRDRVVAVLSTHDRETVERLVDAALGRLTKVRVRHWVARDEFCLSHDERERQRDSLAAVESSDIEFVQFLGDILRLQADVQGVALPGAVGPLTEAARLLLERYLLARGEAFVLAISSGVVPAPADDDVRQLVSRAVGEGLDVGGLRGEAVELLSGVIQTALTVPPESVQTYLRGLADSYTLFAFLRETPNVQSAVSKMFSEGELWLDASFLLPVFAEDLLPERHRLYSRLLRTAREAGIQLRVTSGVVEELERHMNRALVCSRHQHDRWHGEVPFLYLTYIWSGRPRSDFAAWLERFRGQLLPEQDIADYLRDTMGIEIDSLEADVAEAPEELRIAVHEYWSRVQERRRTEPDSMLTARLAQHDVENYLGVVQRRRKQREAPFGYTTWWVTLDRAAYKAAPQISTSVNERFSPPVLSPDFLVNYLAIGPVRSALAKSSEASLPLMLRDLQSLELLPDEILQAAEELRERLKDQPPHVVHRQVRDLLLRAQAQLGPMAATGVRGMQEALRLLLTEAGGDRASVSQSR